MDVNEQVSTIEPDDATIEADVRYELGLATDLEGTAIYVKVSAATATLTGVVDDHSQREMAERRALHVPGVRKVENRLGVRPEWGAEHEPPDTEFGTKGDTEAAVTPPFKTRDAL
jgi:hypothetical protein